MHEYTIVQALIERAATEAQARQATAIHRLSIRIGELSGVEVELLTTAYTTFRERTICAHAELDVQTVAARWACSRCGRPIGRGVALQCPRCGVEARLVEGDEIMLDRIEMEVP